MKRFPSFSVLGHNYRAAWGGGQRKPSGFPDIRLCPCWGQSQVCKWCLQPWIMPWSEREGQSQASAQQRVCLGTQTRRAQELGFTSSCHLCFFSGLLFSQSWFFFFLLTHFVLIQPRFVPHRLSRTIWSKTACDRGDKHVTRLCRHNSKARQRKQRRGRRKEAEGSFNMEGPRWGEYRCCTM